MNLFSRNGTALVHKNTTAHAIYVCMTRIHLKSSTQEVSSLPQGTILQKRSTHVRLSLKCGNRFGRWQQKRPQTSAACTRTLYRWPETSNSRFSPHRERTVVYNEKTSKPEPTTDYAKGGDSDTPGEELAEHGSNPVAKKLLCHETMATTYRAVPATADCSSELQTQTVTYTQQRLFTRVQPLHPHQG